MAGHAVFLCLFRRDPPDMGFVALTAFHPHILNMGFVFADFDYIFVTRQAVPPVWSGGLVRFMTLIAVELHRRIFRSVYLYGPLDGLFVRLEMGDIERCSRKKFFSVFFTAMAVQAFLRPGPQICSPVCVTVEASQLFHPCAVHFLALMTGQAVPFFQAELMSTIAVTFGAFNLFYKDMFCMVSRTADVRSVGILAILFPMTGKTCFQRHYNFTVPWRYLVMAEDHKIIELPHLVDLCGVMALMAVYFMMYACYPCLICLIMNMTDRA
jgi:hypothetical protein